MNKRAEFVSKMTDLFGKRYFAYGGYKDKPAGTPYALYLEVPSEKKIKADDSTYVRIRSYLVRMVTETKSWDYEDYVEEIFEDLDFEYMKETDEPWGEEKVHVVEWIVEFIDNRERKSRHPSGE